MVPYNWRLFSRMLALYVRQQMGTTERGAMLIRCTADGSMVAALYGNDGYARDARSRCEVELVRRWLKDAAVEELGFGLSSDGVTWALVLRAEKQTYQTQAGRTFQMEMLKALLDDIVWKAWKVAGLAFSPQRQTVAEEVPQPQ